MIRDVSLTVTAVGVVGGVLLLALSPVAAPPACPQTTTVVQYFPVPEPQPIVPPVSLPAVNLMPDAPVTPVADNKVVAEEPQPVEEVQDRPPTRRLRHWRHYGRYRRR